MNGNPIIMVVDDQPDLVDGIKLILEVEGYEVWTAANGQHALDKLETAFMKRNEEGGKKALPDLVLSDIMMPVMDGYTLFERVKANPYLKGIPFIFLTAKVDDVDIQRGKNLGVDDYLTKPAQPDDLLSTIRSRLKSSSGPRPSGMSPRMGTSGGSSSDDSSSSNVNFIIIAAVFVIIAIVVIGIIMMNS